MLVLLDLSQLMQLYEVIPAAHPEQQRQIVIQLQEFFRQMTDDTFRQIHTEIAHCAAANAPARLREILVLADPFVFLYQPLLDIVRLALSDTFRLASVLRCLKPVQVLQLTALRQMEQYDIMRLYTSMSNASANAGSVPVPLQFPALGLPMAPPRMLAAQQQQQQLSSVPIVAAASSSSSAAASSSASSRQRAAAAPTPSIGGSNAAGTHTLTFVDEPDEAVVYRRNVKQHPVLHVTCPVAEAAHYVVTLDLVRCDTNEEVTHMVESGREEQSVSGGVVSFKKIKISTTSHQLGESMFALRFKLTHRRTRVVEAQVQSRPFVVVSHSSQISSVRRENQEQLLIPVPAVQECIPPAGPTVGGTRIALLGGDFVSSPALCVRFGDTVVPASMRSAGTLLLRTPAHEHGAVEVRVSNDNASWSSTTTTFVFEDGAAPAAAAATTVNPFEAGTFAEQQAELFASLPINLVRAMDDDAFDALFGGVGNESEEQVDETCGGDEHQQQQEQQQQQQQQVRTPMCAKA